MVSSHARLSTPRKVSKNLKARKYASWTISSASAELRVSHRAKLYAPSKCGNTHCSKRASLSLSPKAMTVSPCLLFPMQIREESLTVRLLSAAQTIRRDLPIQYIGQARAGAPLIISPPRTFVAPLVSNGGPPAAGDPSIPCSHRSLAHYSSHSRQLLFCNTTRYPSGSWKVLPCLSQ